MDMIPPRRRIFLSVGFLVSFVANRSAGDLSKVRGIGEDFVAGWNGAELRQVSFVCCLAAFRKPQQDAQTGMSGLRLKNRQECPCHVRWRRKRWTPDEEWFFDWRWRGIAGLMGHANFASDSGYAAGS